MSLSSLLESLANIRKPVYAQGVQKGKTLTYPNIDVPKIRCSVQPTSAEDKDLYRQRNVFVSTTIYFADDPTAVPDDRIEILDPDDETTIVETYLVQGGDRYLRQRIQAPYFVHCTRIK